MIARIYQAILNGDRLKWKGQAPLEPGPVEVQVTIVGNPSDNGEPISSGQAMAEALAALAARSAFASVNDATAWQRQTRLDRDLPSR